MSDLMAGFVVALMYFLLVVVVGLAVNLFMGGCANDGKRDAWIECAVTSHGVCRMMDYENEQRCEYEYYKRCIGE